MTSSLNPNFSEKAFAGLGSLIKLLPTGTIFLFQFASPILTNSGSCNTLNKTLEAVLIGLCGLSFCFACFTDSYISSDGKRRYGIVTPAGLWISGESPAAGISGQYRLRLGDFVHAFFSVAVFAALALLDSNAVQCFYPEFVSEQKLLLQVLPPLIGAFSGVVFVLFPNERHGIGYPESSDEMTTTSQNPNSVEHA